MFFSGNRVLSIDMGNHSYKLIEAQRKPVLRILRFGVYPKVQLIKANNPAREMRQLGFRTKNAIISYHHSSLIIRELFLPFQDEVQDNTLVNLSVQDTVQQYETYFKEELDYDYSIGVQEEGVEFYHATTVTISKNINRMHINQAVTLGLKPFSVDVQINAVRRFIREVGNIYDYLLVDFGYKNTTVAIISSEHVPILKVLPIGCEALQKEDCQLEEILGQLLTTCHQQMDYSINKAGQKPLTHGIIYGGGTYIPDIKCFLRDQIHLEWSTLEELHHQIPLIPNTIDLNIYGNCLGSLLYDNKNNEKGV
jgi:hypothetical protein